MRCRVLHALRGTRLRVALRATALRTEAIIRIVKLARNVVGSVPHVGGQARSVAHALRSRVLLRGRAGARRRESEFLGTAVSRLRESVWPCVPWTPGRLDVGHDVDAPARGRHRVRHERDGCVRAVCARAFTDKHRRVAHTKPRPHDCVRRDMDERARGCAGQREHATAAARRESAGARAGADGGAARVEVKVSSSLSNIYFAKDIHVSAVHSSRHDVVYECTSCTGAGRLRGVRYCGLCGSI